MRRIVILLLLSVSAQAGVWGERGATRAFAVSGDRVYAADGRGVAVYDVSNAANIRRIDVERSDSESHDLALAGANALVVATKRGFERFAIATDGTLARVETRDVEGVTHIAANERYIAAVAGTTTVLLFEGNLPPRPLTFAREVQAIHFAGGVLFVAVSETAIFAYDPATGAQLASVGFDAADLAHAGTMMWAVGGRGLAVIDIANPRAPQLVGRAGADEVELSAVAAAGTRAYAIESPDRLHVFDGSNPAEPRLVTTIQDWSRAVGASGTRAFLSGAIIDEEGLPFETGIPLRVYDVQNTAQSIGEFRDLAGPVSGVWTDGSLAYVVDPPFLRVIDVSTTEAPRELSSITVPRIQDHIRVKNGLAILYGRSDVNFIDVSDPIKPRYLGTYDALGHPPSAAAILRDAIVEANDHSGLHVVDYSDPVRPLEIATRIWHYHDLAAGDDAIYALQAGALLIADITDRRRVVDRELRLLDGIQIDTLPPNAAEPQYLVWRGRNELVTLDLRDDRFNPKEIATISLPSPGLFGTTASSIYVTMGETLSRVDVTDPATVLETGMRVLAPMQISAVGEKVVVADRYALRVFGPDTEPPPQPRPEPRKRRAARH